MTTPEQQALLDDLISHLDDAATHVKALIAENLALKAELERVKAERDDWGKRWHQERRKVAELRYPGMTGVVKPMAEELEAIKQGAWEPVAWANSSALESAKLGRERYGNQGGGCALITEGALRSHMMQAYQAGYRAAIKDRAKQCGRDA